MLINPVRFCAGCREEKRAYSEQLFANGLYGFYCKECDEKEGASNA